MRPQEFICSVMVSRIPGFQDFRISRIDESASYIWKTVEVRCSIQSRREASGADVVLLVDIRGKVGPWDR